MWHGSLVRKLLGLPPGGDEDGHRRKIRITADEFQQAGVHVEDFELV
jgi:hypothetical protein